MEKNTVLREHPLPVLLCPLHIPHGLAGNLAFHSKRPASATAWPKSPMNTHETVCVCTRVATHTHTCAHNHTEVKRLPSYHWDIISSLLLVRQNVKR